MYADNWTSFEIFWVVKEQWNVIVVFDVMHYQSIQITAIESACRILNIDDTKAILSDLLQMQNAAKAILNQR